jgi:hypothetical protein
MHKEKPKAIYWLRVFFLRSGAQQKGGIDGNATVIATKNKAGHLQKLTNEDLEELGIQGKTHKHVYLEKEDGTPIRARRLMWSGSRCLNLIKPQRPGGSFQASPSVKKKSTKSWSKVNA